MRSNSDLENIADLGASPPTSPTKKKKKKKMNVIEEPEVESSQAELEELSEELPEDNEITVR